MDITTRAVRYAYYSYDAERFGSSMNVYRTEDGREVPATAVCDDPDSYKWADKALVGENVTWVRNIRPSTRNGYMPNEFTP